MSTLTEMEARYGASHHDYLDKGIEIPIVTNLAFQGDVAIIRINDRSSEAPIPASGYPVVKGENGGNTHALFGRCYFTPQTPTPANLALGVLTVPAGDEALLSHPEHGGLLIAPGSYEIRRQREMADELRMVAD